MTPIWHIHCVPHTHNVMNQHNATTSKRPRRDPDTRHNKPLQAWVPATSQEKCAHRWWSTGARPKTNTRKSCKSTPILYTEALDPMEQATKRCHHGNKHKPPYEGPMMLLGTSKHIHLIQGSFTFPCIPFFIPFISTTCWQGLCTNRGTDTNTH